jgi:uncharacterized peroxidase-related enzyme
MTRPKFQSLANAKGIVDVFMENPKKYGVALTLAQEILREDSALPALDREIIAAYTSYLNGCEYCCGSHTEFVLSLGGTEEDVLAINNSENFTGHRLDPLLSYVKKLTKDPSSISDDDKNTALSAGFSQEELKDAIAVCSIFNFYNRIVEGHGISKNEETWAAASKMINDYGYDRRNYVQ